MLKIGASGIYARAIAKSRAATGADRTRRATGADRARREGMSGSRRTRIWPPPSTWRRSPPPASRVDPAPAQDLADPPDVLLSRRRTARAATEQTLSPTRSCPLAGSPGPGGRQLPTPEVAL